jgi:hypothetical protein
MWFELVVDICLAAFVISGTVLLCAGLLGMAVATYIESKEDR